MHDDDVLAATNGRFGERYATWVHHWLPEQVPMKTFQGIIFHTGLFDLESTRGRRFQAVRCPRTTVANWVTEVCDEIV